MFLAYRKCTHHATHSIDILGKLVYDYVVKSSESRVIPIYYFCRSCEQNLAFFVCTLINKYLVREQLGYK